jgi:hypothetical protein
MKKHFLTGTGRDRQGYVVTGRDLSLHIPTIFLNIYFRFVYQQT